MFAAELGQSREGVFYARSGRGNQSVAAALRRPQWLVALAFVLDMHAKTLLLERLFPRCLEVTRGERLRLVRLGWWDWRAPDEGQRERGKSECPHVRKSYAAERIERADEWRTRVNVPCVKHVMEADRTDPMACLQLSDRAVERKEFRASSGLSSAMFVG